jgi:hypothetical protein
MKNLVNNGFNFRFLLSLLIVVFLFSSMLISAQENSCLSKLKKAQELFDSGLIEEIPTMLDSCLKSGFNKEQSIQAYRLLIQVYLFDSNQEKAEQTMFTLLERYPEYEIQSNDPVDFVNLYNLFQTTPLYSFSVNAGFNLSKVSVLERYSTGNLNDLNAAYKTGGLKAGIRVSFEKYLNPKAWVTLGLGYSGTGYVNEEHMNFNTELLTYTENMTYLYFPHYFNYSIKQFNKVTPYVIIGGQLGYLLKSESEITRKSVGNSSGADLNGFTTDITDTRYRINYSLLAGIGIRYKIASGYLRFNVFYTQGLTDYVKNSTRYSDKDNLYWYNYIDSKIKLNYINLTIGYSYIFYRTSKKIVKLNRNFFSKFSVVQQMIVPMPLLLIIPENCFLQAPSDQVQLHGCF